RLRGRYYLSSYRRRLALSGRGARSVLAGGGRMVDGEPYAGRVGQPGVGDGHLPAPAHRGVDHAYGSWQQVWSRELSAIADPARDTTQHEPQREWLGQCGGGELLPYLKDRIDLCGGL